LSLLSHLPSFANGVHPAESKERTAQAPIEQMPFVHRYTLPLGQHIGAPSKPCVSKGQKVARGQVVAEAGGFVSTTLHSPVAGKVTAIAKRRHPNGEFMDSIEIESDPFASQRFVDKDPIDWRRLSNAEFVDQVQTAGLVGLGGAAFPSHVKYALPEGRKIDHLILNGCECEPFLTCDHRLMVERAKEVIRGTEILANALGIEQITIGVEANKPDAVVALREATPSNLPIDVRSLEVKYPQGAEKMLIKALFGQEVPPGKLPLDLGMLVNNVGSMAAIADYFDRGLPLIDRVVTVSGPGVLRPTNLLLPIGTPVREVLEHCGGIDEDISEIVMGGPMMGFTLASLDAPVLKGTSGILVFTKEHTAYPAEYTCIRCARCLEACPIFLNPSRLGKLSRAGRYEEMQDYHLMDCMDCGACSYACPSSIPLVQLIRVGKSILRDQAKKEKEAT
jgi:electron transport complex protein RnfC